MLTGGLPSKRKGSSSTETEKPHLVTGSSQAGEEIKGQRIHGRYFPVERINSTKLVLSGGGVPQLWSPRMVGWSSGAEKHPGSRKPC